MALEILVLAAGLGKRMRSSLPKVLHPLAGRPLLAHVLDTARELSPRKIIVVHGHGAEQVKEAFPEQHIEWVLQAEQLGTAHAVMQAMPRVSADADVLLLYGDVPLVRAATLKRLLEAAPRGARGPHRRSREPRRLWPHRARRLGAREAHRRAARRIGSRARDPRDQRRLLRAERAAAVGLAEEDRQPQRAEGVLPHRPGRARGRRRACRCVAVKADGRLGGGRGQFQGASSRRSSGNTRSSPRKDCSRLA